MIMHYYVLTKQGQHYRSAMLRRADNERLARLAEPRADYRLIRQMLAFTGRRLMAAGLYLMSTAYGVEDEYRTVQARRV